MTGQELREFRLQLGLSQNEFGRELGFRFPQVQISQLEREERPVTVRLEKTISKWKESINLKTKLVKNGGKKDGDN